MGTAAEIVSSFPALGNLHTVELTSGVDVASTLQSLRSDPNVLYAEPDYRITLSAIPNDPQFSSLWGLNNTGQTGGTEDADIDAAEAWSASTGSGSSIVAVIDTGVDYLHEDLADNIWVNVGEIPGDGIDNDANGYVDDIHGYDFFNDDADPMDDHNHGTHVAGTIGAVGNNSIGVVGVNWDVQIMALKFLDADGSGSISDAIEAINYAVANGATISNNSWGFGDGFSQALYDAIDAAGAQDHIVMAAAGNGNFIGFGQDNDATPFYPSSFDLDNIVAVAALDHSDSRAVFSNFGATSVDVGAPGVDILSTFRNDTYGSISGTSMATPHAAGVVALIRDVNPVWNYTQVIGQLLATADPVIDLQGITTTGGRVNAGSALIPDTFGPRVIAADPAEPIADPLTAITVRFDETIDVSSFTTDDIVELTGPNGAITATNVSPVAGSLDRAFQIQFPEQTDVGEYRVVIGPDIFDANGNAMDQDDDDIGGEPLEDQFAATVTLVLVLERFDFGPSNSQVEAGFIEATSSTTYSATLGHGFQTTGVGAADRASGSDLARDLIFGHDYTFAVDVPNAIYRITLTTGDHFNIVHDQMAVHLEGVQVDTIDTAGQQVIETVYDNIRVDDGQLTLRMNDLGGVDANAVLNGLVVQWVAEEQSGPYVAELTRNGTASDPLNELVLRFNETIDPATFTLADVVSLTGPQGAIAPTSLTVISGTEFALAIPQQVGEGTYELVVGPDIEDATGNLMDQDQDGATGETLEDRFTGTVTLVPVADQRFDFGPSNSPVELGYVGISPSDTYSSTVGYGFQAGTVKVTDRGSGTALERDLAYSQDFTFAVDLPSAIYRITLTTGDRFNIAHDQMAVYLEREQVDTIDTLGQQVIETVYDNVRVDDGQLTLRMDDLGGSDVNSVLNGLVVQWVGGEQSGPFVAELTRSGSKRPG